MTCRDRGAGLIGEVGNWKMHQRREHRVSCYSNSVWELVGREWMLMYFVDFSYAFFLCRCISFFFVATRESMVWMVGGGGIRSPFFSSENVYGKGYAPTGDLTSIGTIYKVTFCYVSLVF